MQKYTNAIKYIDGNGFGEKLLNEGDNLASQFETLEESYEEKLRL